MQHVWWECPEIRVFWNKVFVIKRRVTDIPVPQLHCIALLNEKVDDSVHSTQRLIHVMLLAAKLVIAWSWKPPSVNIAMFRRKVYWIMFNEHLASKLTNFVPQIRKVWEPWASYVNIDLKESSYAMYPVQDLLVQDAFAGSDSRSPLLFPCLFPPLGPVVWSPDWARFYFSLAFFVSSFTILEYLLSWLGLVPAFCFRLA